MGLARFAAPLALIAVAAAPAAAVANTVTPVILDLTSSGRGVVANISLSNTGTATMPVEIQTVALAATAKGVERSDGSTDDLLVTPPSALIAPGRTQTFRVQWIGDPELTQSRHYYVGLNQLPVKLPDGQSAVQVVYNFQVLVSVSGTGKQARLTVLSAEPASLAGKPAVALTVRNDGEAHGYISQHRLQLTATDPAKGALSTTIAGADFQQLVGYGLVATGQSRVVTVPVDGWEHATAIKATLLDERPQ